MSVIVSRSSGSVDDEDIAEVYEDASDILIDCIGGCKKKILVFGSSNEGAECLECLTKRISDL